jgi:hypothetical protein
MTMMVMINHYFVVGAKNELPLDRHEQLALLDHVDRM